MRPLQSPRTVRCAIAVPCFDHGETVGAVVAGCRAHAPPGSLIVVVDDGSTTPVESYDQVTGASVEIIRQSDNQGKGAALLRAARLAMRRGYSHLLTIDADGQHDPAEIPKLLAAARQRPQTIVIGYRDMRDAPRPSRFGRWFTNLWVRMLTLRPGLDSQSGFRVYPLAALLATGVRARRYAFEIEVLLRALRGGFSSCAVPVAVSYPADRITHFRQLRDNLQITWANLSLLALYPLWPLGYPIAIKGSNRPQRGQSRGHPWGYGFFFWLLKRFRPGVPRALLAPVVAYYVLFSDAQLLAADDFLRTVLGETRLPGRLRRRYRLLHRFASVLLDRLLLAAHGASVVRTTSEGSEHIHERVGSGAILLSGHVGNYEVAASVLDGRQVPVHVVMLDREHKAIKAMHRRFALQSRLKNVIVVDDTDTEADGATASPERSGSAFKALEILSVLRRGELVAMHGDRVLDGSSRSVTAQFFGRPWQVPTGPFELAAAARVPVVFTVGLAGAPGEYTLRALAPRSVDLSGGPQEKCDRLREHAQWYSDILEGIVREDPYQWFNFYPVWCAKAA